ncbi:hypothetical protein LLEC1_08153 [Akanthomyces lecanii]|uniref:Uncharacterized protein n=1 Tax=Cordyceps confragosa TaxID=2714763 RepID=A0A179I674_CORDF|nr:hypothetical protein LLEC1_08153 [Akanthomyces lecanii]
MSVEFSGRHMPALFAATTTSIGGFWPLFAPAGAMREFGFPEHVARSPAAQPVMAINGARTTVLGIIMLILYFRGMLEECDILLALMGGYLGLVDSCVCWRQGNPGKAVFRLMTSLGLGAWGFFGQTSGAAISW